jgi:hypothetical protein
MRQKLFKEFCVFQHNLKSFFNGNLSTSLGTVRALREQPWIPEDGTPKHHPVSVMRGRECFGMRNRLHVTISKYQRLTF